MSLEVQGLAEQWFANMSTDLTRYAVFSFAVWLVLWVVLAKPLNSRKIRAATPSSRQMFAEFFYSLRSVAIFSTIGLIPFGLEQAGLLHGHQIATSWGPWWFAASLVLIILAHDAYFYWVHRLVHDPRLFRRFHRRHHLSHNPSPFTAYSFDIGEAALMAAFVPVWVVLVPTPWPVVGLFVVHQIIRNTLGHSGYEIMPAGRDGKPLIPWLTTVTHHDLHHADARWNYGLYFTWWDHWMKTEHPQYLSRFAQATGQKSPAVDAVATHSP